MYGFPGIRALESTARVGCPVIRGIAFRDGLSISPAVFSPLVGVRIAVLFFLACLILVSAAGLNAQEAEADQLEVLLESALSAAEKGQWDQALEWLDRAELLAADDSRIDSYRASILELSALDQAQDSWARGEPAGVNGTQVPSDGADSSENKPKFVIDRGEDDSRNAASAGRDSVRLDLSFKLLSVNPLTESTVGNWSSPSEFFYSSMGADLRYWFPFLNKSLGLNFRRAGYSWVPGDVNLLFNTLDLGLNLRGFLLETFPARLEIGLDLGASLHTLKPTADTSTQTMAVFLGLWAADPVFFHVFNVDSLRNLIIGGELRIYSSTAEELLETIKKIVKIFLS